LVENKQIANEGIDETQVAQHCDKARSLVLHGDRARAQLRKVDERGEDEPADLTALIAQEFPRLASDQALDQDEDTCCGKRHKTVVEQHYGKVDGLHLAREN